LKCSSTSHTVFLYISLPSLNNLTCSVFSLTSTSCAEVESWEVAPTFKELLANTSIQFSQDTVRSIQPFDAVNGTPALATASRDVGGSVYLSSGTQVDYDWYTQFLLLIYLGILVCE
jgi:hypothetical protein